MQFLVFIFHYVKILAALYRRFLGCVFLCEFSVSTDCVRQLALPAASTCWFGMFLLTTLSPEEELQARSLGASPRSWWTIAIPKRALPSTCPSGHHPESIHWSVESSCLFLCCKVAEPGVRLLSNWFLQKTEVVFQLRVLQGAHRLVWLWWGWQADSNEIIGNRNFWECVHGGGQI